MRSRAKCNSNRVARAPRILAPALSAFLAVAAGGPAIAAAGSERGAAGIPELTVYAAASLREALQALQPACETEAGARLRFNFGASNDLARQIVAAHKADVFFSADEEWMEHVAQAGLVDNASRRSHLSNRLVVVGREGIAPAVAAPADLAGPAVSRLSLANPDAVPAGKYAKAWLVEAGVWDRVQDRIVPAFDVRAALAAVESGAADLGIVYSTDARLSGKVQVLYEVPERDGPPISYPVAAMDSRPHLNESRRLVACLTGEAAAGVFRGLGFIVRTVSR